MEIKHIDGSITDTNKLTDIKAMQMELVSKFLTDCENIGLPIFLTYRLDCNSFCGARNAKSMCGNDEKQITMELIQDTIERCQNIVSKHAGKDMVFALMDRQSYETLIEGNQEQDPFS